MIDELHEAGVEDILTAVSSGATPEDEVGKRRYANKRAEILWGLRERALASGLHLPPGDESEILVDEMASVKWSQTASGKTTIET